MQFRHETVIPNEAFPFRLFLFEGKNGNYKVTKHWHRSVEIFLVMEGRIDFYINSSLYELRSGNFIIVNSNEIHSIDCPEPNETIVLQIPADQFAGFGDEDGFLSFAPRGDEQDERLKGLINDMFCACNERKYGYELKVKSQFMELLYLLVTEFQEKQEDTLRQTQKKHLDKLSRVTAYMKEHYNRELSQEEVARHFGFTPAYLSRIFKKYAQIGYRTYLSDLRMRYALREMMNSDRQLGDIALDNGFSDSRAFAKAFKKRYGCLPSEYRKRQAK